MIITSKTEIKYSFLVLNSRFINSKKIEGHFLLRVLEIADLEIT